MIVLDTNVLSEILRPKPDPMVFEWLSAQANTSVFTTAITQAEMMFGVALLESEKRRDELTVAVDQIFTQDLEGKVLPFDHLAARVYATIAIERRRAASPISQSDAQIAAIVRCHGAKLATRNVRDFQGCGIEVLNPWSSLSIKGVSFD